MVYSLRVQPACSFSIFVMSRDRVGLCHISIITTQRPTSYVPKPLANSRNAVRVSLPAGTKSIMILISQGLYLSWFWLVKSRCNQIKSSWLRLYFHEELCVLVETREKPRHALPVSRIWFFAWMQFYARSPASLLLYKIYMSHSCHVWRRDRTPA